MHLLNKYIICATPCDVLSLVENRELVSQSEDPEIIRRRDADAARVFLKVGP